MTDDTVPDLTDTVNEAASADEPNDAADPRSLIESKIPEDIRARFELHSYRSAVAILSDAHPAEFAELLDTLRGFAITRDMIRRAGGNESDIPKLLSRSLRPKGWNETLIQGDLHLNLVWREQDGASATAKTVRRDRTIIRRRFLDGHKVDYVKNRIAFDLEWNSKDQTFDRDLYAFAAFAQCGVVDAGVLLTRSKSLERVFRSIGPALKRDGSVEFKKAGTPRPLMEKYGASTTHMGKLLYRLNAGRNGGCPVLAIGITPACVTDWSETDAA